MNKEIIKNYIPENTKVDFVGNIALVKVEAVNILEIANDLYNHKNLPLKLVTATDERFENGCFKIWYIFGIPKENIFIALFIELKNIEEFPSIVSVVFEAGNYERKIKTFFGLTPAGAFDTRPIILHENWPIDVFPLRKDFNLQTKVKQSTGTYEFQRVDGEGIYEIPVGPIHAGIIEPGHFRFSVAGEEIMLLEARLGFVHKSIEKIFESEISIDEKIKLSEKISGDSSFSYSAAFCRSIENLAGIEVSKRAEYLRAIYSELERLTNHFGDVGAMMLDTGFNFGGANGSRLREIVMQLNERLTGSRFLRGVNVVGGVTKDIDLNEKQILLNNLEKIFKDFEEVIEVVESKISLLNRLRGTGAITHTIAKDFGVLGVPARAVGIENDTRLDFPYSVYQELDFSKAEVQTTGDVYARFYVRIKEIRTSFNLIEKALINLPEGKINSSLDKIVLKKNSVVITLVEGWRGEIAYFITTDLNGNISRVYPRDPSFLNWSAVGCAGPGNVVPDFPLINKSFNLSYTGNDL
ncbi:MAG: NADH-quinone oxidoreductase subunit C [Candidatus Nomurabacteria bacterium]|nr:NADH-quinone oxidoreductase subunit C [Candidatus Nomurabacteria bacterium]